MRLLLCVALAALAITFFAPEMTDISSAVEPNVVPATQRSTAITSGSSATSSVGASLLLKRQEEPESSMLFPVKTWQPTSSDSVMIAPAEQIAAIPTAPPLPFRFVGQLKQEDGTLYVLEHGGRTSMIGVGESIGGQYLLESVNDGALSFRYLPLQEMQSLALPAQP